MNQFHNKKTYKTEKNLPKFGDSTRKFSDMDNLDWDLEEDILSEGSSANSAVRVSTLEKNMSANPLKIPTTTRGCEYLAVPILPSKSNSQMDLNTLRINMDHSWMSISVANKERANLCRGKPLKKAISSLLLSLVEQKEKKSTYDTKQVPSSLIQDIGFVSITDLPNPCVTVANIGQAE